jgi:hypothetical protein
MAYFDYTSYNDIANIAATNPIVFSIFKRQPAYVQVLEHVSFHQGLQYLQCCRQYFSIPTEEIQEFCKLNDRFGEPEQFDFCPGLRCSPSSIRYVFQSLLLLEHIKSLGLTNVSIVEVGSGYGGLCLALQHFAKKKGVVFSNYACIDLTGPSQLQKMYLSNHNLPYPVTFHDASLFGKDVQGENLYFISNYCFSEICMEYQTQYKEFLLPKCNHGFITWNNIDVNDVYDIGKQTTVTDEIPQTGTKNKFVYF